MKNEQLNMKDSCEFSYINHITSEQEYKNSDKYEKDKAYWNDKFSTVPEVAFIPSTIKSDSESSSINANRKAFSINSDLLNKLKVFCSSQKISLFNFFVIETVTFIILPLRVLFCVYVKIIKKY